MTQQAVLNLLQRTHTPAAVYLLSGIKLQGVILAHTDTTLLLRHTYDQWVYQHIISTIMPLQSNTVVATD